MTVVPSFSASLHEGHVRLAGELVGDAAQSTMDQVRRFAASNEAPTIEVDLTDITFMDSVGLRELLTLKRSVPTLRVVAMNRRLCRMFAITGTTELLLSPGGEAAPPPEP